MKPATSPRNTIRHDRDNAISSEVSFGLVDDKGRELGAHTYIVPYTVTAGYDGPSTDGGYMCAAEPGSGFLVNVHVTRNGKRFGASHPSHTCATLEAAQRQVAVLVAAARTRYAKQLAKSGRL